MKIDHLNCPYDKNKKPPLTQGEKWFVYRFFVRGKSCLIRIKQPPRGYDMPPVK